MWRWKCLGRWHDLFFDGATSHYWRLTSSRSCGGAFAKLLLAIFRSAQERIYEHWKLLWLLRSAIWPLKFGRTKLTKLLQLCLSCLSVWVRVSRVSPLKRLFRRWRKAKVLAIFRVKGSARVAIDRGLELASLGCKAMEITIDSPDWKTILSTLRQRLPADVVLGIGTVMDDTVSEIPLAKSLGATFCIVSYWSDWFDWSLHFIGSLGCSISLYQ